MKCCHSTDSVIALFVLLIIPRLCYSSYVDSITPSQPLKDGDVLVSPRKTFALGFFNPTENSTRRYVGIWYNTIPGKTIVWVANRDDPINDTSAVLAVHPRRGLILSAGDKKSTIWSTNVSLINASVARLLDVGNFVLLVGSESVASWQSFDHPTDTMLPFMTMGLNRKTGLDRFLTSWKSPDNPATGNCTLLIDAKDSNRRPQLFLKRGGSPVWRGGPWTGLRWSGVPAMTPKFIFNISYVETLDEALITYGILDQSILSRMAVDGSGRVYRATWHPQIGRWTEFWKAPDDSCDSYRVCGANGYCDASQAEQFECTCMPGFKPRVPREWLLREGSGGCVRKRVLGCEGGRDGFVKLERAKLPETSVARVVWTGPAALRLEDCERECRKNCSCTAYSRANESEGGMGCMMWHGDLIDTRVFPIVGQSLFIRVDATTLGEYAKKSKRSVRTAVKLALGLASGLILFLLFFIVVLWAKKTKKVRGAKQRFYSVSPNITPALSQDLAGNKSLDESSTKSDLPIFSLSSIASATDNFSLQNKLGEGGFGSVYKGTLSDGREIAVKRLSKYSGQGSEEFKNEVMLIANLQHRNLVRILGCCVHGEEKMLIYEYLPNKSLEMFIFDDTKRSMLDWRKRFEIICGIARGLLYLHQDSRLRIIHRDLKTSNVLLDAAMNPKIADFGMARIFRAEQNEANTNRVVGTYGYMSPEYAMEGRFSTKSDVYSFGVLLLEIITGKKNTSYFPENPDSNLVGYVWELWEQGKALEVVDSSMDESYSGEALRCFKIGLLCVQDYANDRPSMSTVVFMLGNEVDVPTPKQPAFIFKRNYPTGDLSASDGVHSINDVTCSIVEPR